ncbi:MAG: hypothetical protein AB7E05_05955 [Sphingobium sp.]
MKHEVLDLQFTDLASRGSQFVKGGVLPFVRRNPVLAAALIFTAIAGIYWLFIASDRYVSESHVIVQRTELSAISSLDISTFLTGASTGNRGDQLILRDFLRSKDIVRKLDRELNLREHYSSWRIDPFSRMATDPTIEELHNYYLSRVSIEYDDYSGVLVVKVQGFDPGMAQKINKALVREGERFMNAMAHELARDQVAFLEKEVAVLGKRAMAARKAVLDYQNENGLVSPAATAKSIGSIVAQLEAQRTELQTRLTAMQAYLVSDQPALVELRQQIDAISEQIEEENARLVSPQGNRLNSKTEEFQRLEMEAGFAQDLYKTALIGLEKGRVEGTRTIKKMSIVQTPSLPEYSEQPRRLYETALYAIMAMLFAGVAHLLMAIVRDHRD